MGKTVATVQLIVCHRILSLHAMEGTSQYVLKYLLLNCISVVHS